MKFRTSLKIAGTAARANLLPGLLLQSLMIVFFATYVMHEGTREFLGRVANLKEESGYLFAFTSYIFASALLPEIMRVAFFQNGRVTRHNVWNFFTGCILWGFVGILVDFFYRCQAGWFGTESTWSVILPKILVDQLLFSPFLNSPLIIGAITWRDAGFNRAALRRIFTVDFFLSKVMPVQVAGWCVWVPGVTLVYSMPSELQVPVAVFIQCFWVLIFTTVGERLRTHKVLPVGEK